MRLKVWITVVVLGAMLGMPASTVGTTNSQILQEEIEKILADSDIVMAEVLNYQAAQLERQGKYNEAIPLSKKALLLNKKQLGDNHPTTAINLNSLATLYTNQGRYTDVEPLYKEALAIIKKQLGDNHPTTATSLDNLATLYINQGRYTDAEPLYKEALEIRKKQIRNNYFRIISIFDSLPREKQLGDNYPDIAISLNNLAELYQSQGRYSEAEPLLKEALAIDKKQLGDNDPATAASLNNLAVFYIDQKRYIAAEPLLKEALAIDKKQLGDNHPATARTLNNLALLYQSQGRYTEAEPLLKEALAIRKKQLGDNHPDTAASLNNLALLYQSQGRYTDAELLLKEALAIRKKQLGDNHPNTATSLKNLAVLYEAQGDIPHAVEYLTKGIEVEEFNISQNLIAGNEKQKQDYMTTVSGTTNIVISLNLQSTPNSPLATRLALKTILQRKGRILGILTNSLQIMRQRIDDPQSQKLLTQLIEINTQSANLTFKKVADIKSPKIHRKQLAELASKTKQLEGEISKRSATFRNLSKPITLESIQKLIPTNSALIEIVRYRHFNPKVKKDSEAFGNHHYVVYILYPNGDIKAQDLGEAKPIDDSLENFRKNLTDKKTPIDQIKLSARQLDTKLMQPIRKLLGNTRNILLSPDAALNLIPFEALVDENNQYLIKNYHITYLTSGRDLLRLKDKSPSQQPPLIIADPIYNQAVEFTATIAKNPTRSVDLSTRTFDRLDQTAEEARAVQKLFSLPDSRVLMGKQATETALKQVKSPEFLTIATHGFFFDAAESKLEPNPLLRSGLVFAGFKVGQSGGDDGILTALEATTLNLVGTKLVVLSACDTGVGDITTGEGVYGLRRALVIAGSESQLISLWKVDDNATKDLMVKYYGRLKTGAGRSEALRQIQLEMLKSENYKHPFFWASFIPSGDWTPMKFGLSR